MLWLPELEAVFKARHELRWPPELEALLDRARCYYREIWYETGNHPETWVIPREDYVRLLRASMDHVLSRHLDLRQGDDLILYGMRVIPERRQEYRPLFWPETCNHGYY